MVDTLADPAAELLLDLAGRAIADGLDAVRPSTSPVPNLPDECRTAAGSFVTLSVRGELIGCVGDVESTESLGTSVAQHAWSAAFADPRFPPLGRNDYDHVEIEVSVLSALTRVPSGSRDALIEALRPRVDGLVIVVDPRRAVYLPTVWEQLRTADVFVDRLAWKAGFSSAVWPRGLEAFTFRTETVRGPARRSSPALRGRSALDGHPEGEG